MIKLTNVSKNYYIRSGAVQALKDITLHIGQGEFVSITGKSGSGKSTLLNCIGLLDNIDSGSIFIDGKDVSSLKGHEASVMRNQKLGFVFQSCNLEPSYTVYNNLCIPMYIGHATRKETDRRVDETLELVGLRDKIKRRAVELSGGERQRVSIARALMCNPPIILADEPCGNLDSGNSDTIMKLFRSLSDEGKTVVLITHDTEAAAATDRQLIISDGKLIT